MIPILGFMTRTIFPTVNYSIYNNEVAKNLMYDLAPEQVYNHFYASPASSSSSDIGDTDFIHDSATCGQSGCHTGIYNQWKKSTHAEPALADTWYRSSVANLQKDDEQSTVNYCSGCHAPALLLSQNGEKPVISASEELLAQSNIGCNACHAAKRVNNTMGNGDYVLQRPRSYTHMSSDIEFFRKLFAFKLHVDPDPHKDFFLKPFMTRQNSEFCSSCHKLNSAIRQTQHLAIGAMDNYDSWQKSAFAGKRIDTFKDTREHDCADCHMPRMRMDDPAAKSGTVHDHSFNYHVVNQKGSTTENDLIVQRYKINPIRLDVVSIQKKDGNEFPTQISYFDEDAVSIQPGATVGLQVLVQSNEIGHDFPGRYSESIETWLEVKVRDEHDRLVFQSGTIDDFNRVDKDAMKWGTVYYDRKGRLVTWPHGFTAGKITYDHRLKPLTSEVVHYEFQIPENCGDELYITARLKQRNIQEKEDELLTMKSSNGVVHSPNAMSSVHVAKIVAETLTGISIAKQLRLPMKNTILGTDEIYQIWFNYGIALFLKQEWDDAERAFLQAAKINGDDVHLWINMARAALEKSDWETTEIYLEKARAIEPGLDRIVYYQAMMADKKGNLDEALSLLRDIRKNYYTDRVFLLKLAEVQMKRQFYKRAGKWYKKILEFAPDDLDAHRGLREVYKNLDYDEGFQNEDKLVRALEKALSHHE